MNRCEEPGWIESPLRERDPSGRRSVWVRETPTLPEDGVRRVKLEGLELCAGREGDDLYVSLTVGKAPTSMDLYMLCQIAQYELSWMVESPDSAAWRARCAELEGALESLLKAAEEARVEDRPTRRDELMAARTVLAATGVVGSRA